MADHVRISKALSYWLRHRPEKAGLSLDPHGWANVDAVLAALRARNICEGFETLLAVVEQSDKQRYELSPDLSQIRARQGHSVEVELALSPTAPPARLYHGTVDRFLDAIMAEGLSKMRRHHVHLSPDIETAQRVGARRGKPVILIIDAATMQADGCIFFVTANQVWLTDTVAPRYLTRT